MGTEEERRESALPPSMVPAARGWGTTLAGRHFEGWGTLRRIVNVILRFDLLSSRQDVQGCGLGRLSAARPLSFPQLNIAGSRLTASPFRTNILRQMEIFIELQIEIAIPHTASSTS
jgi:hypothetical protein